MSVTGVSSRRTIGRRSVIGFALAVLLSLISLVDARPAAAAGPCGPPVTSVIACENTKPRDPPGGWQGSGAGGSAVPGGSPHTSADAGRGEAVTIKPPPPSY